MKLKKKVFYSLILFSALLNSCSSKNTIDSYIGFDISKESIDYYLNQKMEDLDIPGISIAFINNGKVVYHTTKGFSNKQKQLPVTNKTIFEAASLSKPLFTYFVMKYVEEGKLDLDKPLFQYLPYPDIENDDRYKKITARMVLSHRSGFPNWRSDYKENKLFIQFEPGTTYFYSGEGYQYLAKVLKHIENTDWNGLELKFQEKVAQPIGMKHTVFIQDTYAKENKAAPYDENGQWIKEKNDPQRLLRQQFVAPASAHSESIDFSKWLIALMNKKGLKTATYNEMFKPHSLVEKMEYFDLNYTLGFFNPDIPFTNLYIGGGNNYGFTSFFTIDTNKKWGFVLFTNSEYGEKLGQDLSYYLLTGPNKTKLYLILGFILILLIILIRDATKFIIRKITKRKT